LPEEPEENCVKPVRIAGLWAKTGIQDLPDTRQES
jgi:hypothetical protein